MFELTLADSYSKILFLNHCHCDGREVAKHYCYELVGAVAVTSSMLASSEFITVRLKVAQTVVYACFRFDGARCRSLPLLSRLVLPFDSIKQNTY